MENAVKSCEVVHSVKYKISQGELLGGVFGEHAPGCRDRAAAPREERSVGLFENSFPIKVLIIILQVL